MKELVRYSLLLLNIAGVNLHDWSCFRFLITFCIFFSALTSIALELLLDWQGKASVPEIADFIAMSQGCSKFLMLLINRNQLVDIISLLKEFWPENKFGDRIQRQIYSSETFMKKCANIITAAYIILIMSYVFKPIVSGKKIFPVMWYDPSGNLKENPMFGIIYTVQVICGIFIAILSSGFDILFVNLILYVVLELKLIKEGFSKIFINSTKSSEDEQPLREFNMLVEHHNFVLRFVEKVDRCYSLFLLNQFLSSTFCGCCSLLVLSCSSGEEYFVYLVYLALFLGQIYFYCAVGSHVLYESTTVANTLYEMPWWIKTQPNLRRSMILAIMRSHREAKLTGGGMFTLDLERFTSIIKTGLSFFTLIRTMYGKYNVKDNI